MRTETADWLLPLLAEAARRGDVDVTRCILEAATHHAVVDAPAAVLDALPDGFTGVFSVDWQKFGRLLAHRLGWGESYPLAPPTR